jgi:hypothetical protein
MTTTTAQAGAQHTAANDDQGQEEASHDRVTRYLAAVAARLTARGITSTLAPIGDTLVLTAEDPAGGPDSATVSIDPDPGTGLPACCTCIWTSGSDISPETAAETIAAVLRVTRPRAALPSSSGELTIPPPR